MSFFDIEIHLHNGKIHVLDLDIPDSEKIVHIYVFSDNINASYKSVQGQFKDPMTTAAAIDKLYHFKA